jgi:hypothetical protein
VCNFSMVLYVDFGGKVTWIVNIFEPVFLVLEEK